MAKHIQIKLASGEQIKLTERERMFCEYYLGECNKNGTQAAIKAGYSKSTAKNIANQNLAKLHIQKYIQNRTAPILERMGFTVERALQEIAELALSRPGMIVDKDSEVPLGYQDSHNFKKLTIDGVDVDSHEKTISFNYQAKMKALLTGAEYLGIINRKAPEQPNQPQQINLFQQINNYLKEK